MTEKNVTCVVGRFESGMQLCVPVSQGILWGTFIRFSGLVVPLRLLCLLDHVDATVGGAVVS